MAVTLNQLSSFLAVAREGSVSAAAEKLYVTQPSISAAVSALSRELGVDLTERVGRGVGLTAAGDAFRPYAADVLGLIEQGQQGGARGGRRLDALAAHRRRGDGGRVRRALAAARLRGAAPGDQPLARGREPRLASSTACSSTRSTSRSPAGRPRTSGSPGARSSSNEIALIAAPGDELAGPQAVRPEELATRVWLMREPGSGTRQLVAEFLADHDLRPQTLTLGSNGAIKEAVRLGLGVSLQSRVAVEHELTAGTLAEIKVRGRTAAAGVVRPALGDRAAAARSRAVPRVRLRARRPRGPSRGANDGRFRAARSRRRCSPATSRGSREQVALVMDAGAKVMHVDVMDGHFVPPITIGPLIAESIRDLVHERGGILDCHLMVERPERQVEAFAKAGADVITVHPEATPHIHYALQMIRDAGCHAGVVINPGTPVEVVEPRRRDHRPLPA